MPVLRPMRPDDVPEGHEVALAAFADLARRRGEPPHPPPDRAAAHARQRHCVATDPGGAWVAEDDDGRLAGVALAIVREGVWGLSLLVVRPDRQSGGTGRALLAAALAHGEDARGGIVLASSDARALRAYGRAGFAMHPTATARGVPRDVVADPAVRPWRPGDHALAADVDRAVRGAAHGSDLDVLAAAGHELLVLPGGGYAAHVDGALKLLAAREEAAAAALLRTVLARASGRATVEWLTGAQQWATDVALEAGLELRIEGAVFLRGDVGPFRPYLPGGAFL